MKISVAKKKKNKKEQKIPIERIIIMPTANKQQ